MHEAWGGGGVIAVCLSDLSNSEDSCECWCCWCGISPLLECMARNKLASRLIQQIADPSTTAIQSSSVQYLIRSLIPFLPSLSLDPIGGFVLTSVYNGATVSPCRLLWLSPLSSQQAVSDERDSQWMGLLLLSCCSVIAFFLSCYELLTRKVCLLSLLQPEVKRQIVEALLPIEEELKTANYAAYMKCEVYRYTKSKEQWQARQEKRSKTRVSTPHGEWTLLLLSLERHSRETVSLLQCMPTFALSICLSWLRAFSKISLQRPSPTLKTNPRTNACPKLSQ